MAEWYSDPALGGDGKRYNTDGNNTDPYRKLNDFGWVTNFIPLLVALLGHAAFVVQQALGAVGSAATNGTSTTSLLIEDAVSKVFTTQAGKAWVPGQWAVAADVADPATNYMLMQITAYSGTTLTGYVRAKGGSGTIANWSIGLTGPQAAIGKQTLGVAGGAIFPSTTNGCAGLSQAETATNKVNYKYLGFDAASLEYACFAFPSPKAYNASTFTYRVVWTHPATTTNFKVAWALQILALANDDAIDTAWGTAVQVNDIGGTTQDFYVSDESAAVTPGNTAAKQDWMFCRVSRVATDGTNDTLAVDAHLVGIEVYYTTDAANDA